jgi:hypothetical protein
MYMKRTIPLVLLLLLSLLAVNVHAATVLLDFNDADLGDLPGQFALGTGTTGNWDAATDIDVIAGDLTAPGSTNYAVTQSGTAQSIQGQTGSNARQANVQLSTALTGDTIWGSFLLNLNGSTSGRGGITLNPTIDDTTPNDPRIFALGADFQAWLTGDNGAEINIGSSISASETALILFQIDFNPTGNDTLNLWVNPDVTNLGTASTNSSTDFLGAGGITHLGILSYNGNAPIIDNVRLSDDADAFNQVTAIPEPSSLFLVGVAGMGILILRRFR